MQLERFHALGGKNTEARGGGEPGRAAGALAAGASPGFTLAAHTRASAVTKPPSRRGPCESHHWVRPQRCSPETEGTIRAVSAGPVPPSTVCETRRLCVRSGEPRRAAFPGDGAYCRRLEPLVF